MTDPIVSFIGASGLDTAAIIDALANVRRSPILRLQQQVTKLQKQSTAFSALKTRLEALRSKAAGMDTAAELRAFSAASSDSTAVAASASSAATEGTYNITVANLAQAESQLSTGVAQRTGLAIGSGAISLTVGTKTYGITIAANSDLETIRNSINASGAPVTATIIDDGSGANAQKIVLSSNATGAANAFTVDLTGFTSQVGAFAFGQLNPGLDASFTLNGATIQRASNTVTDLIPGVNLTLQKGGNASSTVTVSKDRQTVKDRIKALVSAFNDVIDVVKSNSNPDLKDTTAVLYGDATLRSIQSTVRGVIDAHVTGTGSTYDSLAAIGITTGADGKLNVDDTKLTNALSADYDGVISLFTSSGAVTGIAVRAQTAASSLQNVSIQTRTEGIQTRIRGINKQVDQLESRLDKYIESLRQKYADLDSLAGRLQSQGSALSSLNR